MDKKERRTRSVDANVRADAAEGGRLDWHLLDFRLEVAVGEARPARKVFEAALLKRDWSRQGRAFRVARF
jgi:hypothetical protein